MGVRGWRLRYLGVFLLSAATLMFQVSYTRVLSVALWHHFVWMVVSIALLGYAVSGVLLTVLPGLREMDLDRAMTTLTVAFSVSIPLSHAALNIVPFDPSRLSWDRLQLLYVAVYYVIFSIPFVLSGLVVTLAIEKSGERVNRLYFSNLTGSALGSFLVLFSFGPLTGSGVVVLSAILAGVSALAFTGLRRTARVVGCWVVVLLVLLPFSSSLLPIQISPYKNLMAALRYPGARLIDTRWNAFSRVDIVESGLVRHAPGLSLKYEGEIPRQIGIIVDGDDLKAITEYDGDPSSLTFTEALPASLPYRLRVRPRVLVVNVGGGLDVLTALYHGPAKITAVEANPLIVESMRGDYAEFSGAVYLDEMVEVVVAESRSFVRTSADEYDVIVLPMVHGASASSTGIYALSENYLYTVESFVEFMGRLSDDGVLCVTTWLLPPPREDVRITSLAISALEAMGVADPSGHIAAIRSWGTITYLIGRSPLSAEDTAEIREFCREMGFDIVHLPDVEPSEVNVYNVFPEPFYYNLIHEMLNAEDREGFYESYLYEIGPTTDERPYFSNFYRWDRLLETYESLDGRWQPLVEGGFLVPLALIQALILSLVIVVLPLWGRIGMRARGPPLLLAYFFCLGLGYMFVEMALVQRFILVLGHPTYSISVVISSLLLASGLGSYLSGRVEPGRLRHRLVLLSVGLLIPLYGFLFRDLHRLLDIPAQFRLIAVFIVILPLGILMGMPFPIGVRLISEANRESIPWAWAVNGCASVLGSIAPSILAFQLGFTSVFLCAGAAYLVNLVIISLFDGS
jgi:hypothetical protein